MPSVRNNNSVYPEFIPVVNGACVYVGVFVVYDLSR